MASIPRVASNALLAAFGIVVDALTVVETLPSETVEDRHTLSPAEAMHRSSRPLPTPLDPDTVRRTCRGGDSYCWRTVPSLACHMETGCIPIRKPLGIASIRMESLVRPVKLSLLERLLSLQCALP